MLHVLLGGILLLLSALVAFGLFILLCRGSGGLVAGGLFRSAFSACCRFVVALFLSSGWFGGIFLRFRCARRCQFGIAAHMRFGFLSNLFLNFVDAWHHAHLIGLHRRALLFGAVDAVEEFRFAAQFGERLFRCNLLAFLLRVSFARSGNDAFQHDRTVEELCAVVFVGFLFEFVFS